MFTTRLQRLTNQWIISLQTFPLTHAVLLFITVVISMMVETSSDTVSIEILSRCLIVGATILPLTIIRPKHQRWQLGLLVGSIAYYFLLPSSIENLPYAQGIILVGTGIITWLAPSLAIAYQDQMSHELTWSELGHWWSSLIQGLIAGAIVRAGISASLASIEFLFDVTISSDVYQHIGNISMILIAGWIRLINLQQHHFETLLNNDATVKTKDSEITYPRWMRIFGQYIFLPLCVIYGLILISYGIKIIATGVWPEGQLIYMVSGYVIFGLLTWFALLPLSSTTDRVRTMYRVLFGSFVVTSGLMIGAIVMRLQQYGLTIDRYLVGSLITWIVVMGVGCAIWPMRRWMIGLGSFVVIIALSIYTGPLSAVGSTYNYLSSQITRSLPLASTSTGDATTLYVSLQYLARNYGTGWTSDFFDASQTTQRSGSNNWSLAEDIMTTLNLTGYDTNGNYPQTDQYLSFYTNSLGVISLDGYRQLLQFDTYRDTDKSNYATIKNNSTIVIATGTINTQFDLSNDIAQIMTSSKSDPSDPYIISQDNYKLIITSLNGQKSGTGVRIESVMGFLLIK